MLKSMATKDGTLLYHIRYGGYGIILGCFATSGIIGCFQLKSWLINVGLVTKHGCGWVCCIGKSTCGPLVCLV